MTQAPSETLHTWMIAVSDGDGGGGRAVRAIFNDAGTEICRMSIEDNGTHAALFCAAPAMLSALRQVGGALSERPKTVEDDELWAAFSAVIAAVAKAGDAA